jgi:hypothetical protein
MGTVKSTEGAFEFLTIHVGNAEVVQSLDSERFFPG